MDVAFHHKRVTPHAPRGFGNQPVAFGNDPLIELLDCLGFDQANVVANSSPIEGDPIVLVADFKHHTQMTVVFGQVLQFIIVQVQTEPDGGQHQDLPVGQPVPTAVGACVGIDITSDQIKDLFAE